MDDVILLWQCLFQHAADFSLVVRVTGCKTPGEMIYDNWVLLEDSAFRQIREFRGEKSLFSKAQNNIYVTGTYSRPIYSVRVHSYIIGQGNSLRQSGFHLFTSMPYIATLLHWLPLPTFWLIFYLQFLGHKITNFSEVPHILWLFLCKVWPFGDKDTSLCLSGMLVLCPLYHLYLAMDWGLALQNLWLGLYVRIGFNKWPFIQKGSSQRAPRLIRHSYTKALFQKMCNFVM